MGQGGTLTLSCIARGYPKPKYKFYRKTSSGQKKAINDPEATKSGRLKFDVISHNQAGVYICEPENTKGRGLPHEVHVQVKCKYIELAFCHNARLGGETYVSVVHCVGVHCQPLYIEWILINKD